MNVFSCRYNHQVGRESGDWNCNHNFYQYIKTWEIATKKNLSKKMATMFFTTCWKKILRKLVTQDLQSTPWTTNLNGWFTSSTGTPSPLLIWDSLVKLNSFRHLFFQEWPYFSSRQRETTTLNTPSEVLKRKHFVKIPAMHLRVSQVENVHVSWHRSHGLFQDLRVVEVHSLPGKCQAVGEQIV